MAGIVEKEEKSFFPAYQKGIVLGVILCIAAMIPLIIFAAFDAPDEMMKDGK